MANLKSSYELYQKILDQYEDWATKNNIKTKHKKKARYDYTTKEANLLLDAWLAAYECAIDEIQSRFTIHL